MPSLPVIYFTRRADGTGSTGAGNGDWRAHATDEDLVLESWSQGFMVGALIIMACITIANMRRKVLLHKLILLEQLLAMSHGTFCFMAFRGYGWYLSATAALLYCSWFIHNLVAWMKIKPFIVDRGSLFSPSVGKWTRHIYMSTLFCTIGPIILQIYDNFRFFNNLGDFYTQVRPYEPLFRDPWWVFTCLVLFHVVQKCYGTGVVELVRRSPRFGILLAAIILSLIFTALDIASSIHDFLGTTDGINPWWKLSLVCKCLTDTIMLDDFKTELKRLGIKRIRKDENRRQSMALVLEDKDTDENGELEFADALNVSPERLAESRRKRKRGMGKFFSTSGIGGGEDGEGRGRLRNESVVVDEELAGTKGEYGPGLEKGRSQQRRDSVGKGGRKIGPLPTLGKGLVKGWRGMTGSAAGDGSSPSMKQKKKRLWDTERDTPDVVRCEPEQQDPLTRQRTWEANVKRQRAGTEGTIGDETIGGLGENQSTERIAGVEEEEIEEERRGTGRSVGARGVGGPGGGGGGGLGTGTQRGTGTAPGQGSPDFDSIDFQSRPAGF